MANVELAETVTQDFRAELHGELLYPDHRDYDAARGVYHVMIDKRPALIVRCTGVADLVAAVDFTRTHDMPVAVRGGGHNVAGNSTCDGGLIIDLSPMKGIRVDPVRTSVGRSAGWASRTPPSATGAPQHSFLVASIWTDPGESDKHIEWARTLSSAMQRSWRTRCM